MRRKVKPPTTEIHPLCAAARRIRMASGMSQERMAQLSGISTQTISRFELGKQEPRDPRILRSYITLANSMSLDDAKLFDSALEAISIDVNANARDNTDPRAWRLMEAARIAALYFPEAARAMEQAAGPALAVIKEVVATSDIPEHLSARFFQSLSERMDATAKRMVLQGFQKESK